MAKQQSNYTTQIETLKQQLAFSLAQKTKFAEKEFEFLENCSKKAAEIMKTTHAVTAGINWAKEYLAKKISSQEISIDDVKENVTSPFMKWSALLTDYIEYSFDKIIFITPEVQKDLSNTIKTCQKIRSKINKIHGKIFEGIKDSQNKDSQNKERVYGHIMAMDAELRELIKEMDTCFGKFNNAVQKRLFPDKEA